MIELEHVIDDKGLDRALREYPRLMALNSAAAMRQGFSTFRRVHTDRSPVQQTRRRGGLARAFRWEVKDTGNTETVTGSYRTGSPVAYIREVGGTIRPNEADYLWIPIGFARRAGKRSAKPRYKDPKKLIDANPGRYSFIPQGRGFVVMERVRKTLPRSPRGRRRRRRRRPPALRPVYALVPRLEVPPRLELFKTWESFGQQEMVRRYNTAIEMTLQGKRIAGGRGSRRSR